MTLWNLPYEQVISLLNGQTGALVGHLAAPESERSSDQSYVPALFFRPSGELVSVTLQRKKNGVLTIHENTLVRVWDPSTGEMLFELPFAAATVDGPLLAEEDFQLSLDGQYLAGRKYLPLMVLSLSDGSVTMGPKVPHFALSETETQCTVIKTDTHQRKLAVLQIADVTSEPTVIATLPDDRSIMPERDEPFLISPDGDVVLIGRHLVRTSDGQVVLQDVGLNPKAETTRFVLGGRGLITTKPVKVEGGDDYQLLQLWGDPATGIDAAETAADSVSALE